MRLFIFFTSSFLMLSCSQKLTLQVYYNEPYCGGAPPTEQQFYGENFPFANQALELKILTSKGKIKGKSIFLDDQGGWTGKTPAFTKIEFYRPEQYNSLDEIKKTFDLGENRFYELLPDKMIEDWKARPIAVLKEYTNKSWSFTIPKKCQVGLNPCYRYVGPSLY